MTGVAAIYMPPQHQTHGGGGEHGYEQTQRRSSLYDDSGTGFKGNLHDDIKSASYHENKLSCYQARRRSSDPAEESTDGNSSISCDSEDNEAEITSDAMKRIEDASLNKPLALEDLGLSPDTIAEIQAEDFADSEEERAFMAECERLGISKELAEAAAKESRDAQIKWWNEMQQGQLDKKKLLNSNGEEATLDPNDPLKGEELGVTNILMSRQRKGSTSSVSSGVVQIHVAPKEAAVKHSKASVMHLVNVAKCEALSALKKSQGDTTNPRFKAALNALSVIYQGSGFSLQSHQSQVQFEGTWNNVSRPNFPNCLGQHPKSGHFMYTLGRMSFDMFRPPNLRCSIQKVLCKTRSLDAAKGESVPREVPSGLRQQIQDLEATDQMSQIRTYDIEVYFTIEPRSIYETMALPDGTKEDVRQIRAPSSSMKATMTSFGYLLPDPENPIRFTVWFTGGVIAPVAKEDPSAKLSASSSKGGSSSKKPSKHGGAKSSSSSSSSRSRHRTVDPRAARRGGGGGGLGAVGEDTESAVVPTCGMSLQECRRRKKCCIIHGVDRVSTEDKKKYNKWNERYARPAHGLYSRAGKTNELLQGPSTLAKTTSPFSAEWEDLFAPEENWRLSFGDRAKGLAIKLLMGATLPTGMEDDGTMEFTLGRPIGGHGTTYIDVLYMDENLRILKGNAGTIFVQAREGMEKQAINAKMDKEDLKRNPVKELEQPPIAINAEEPKSPSSVQETIEVSALKDESRDRRERVDSKERHALDETEMNRMSSEELAVREREERRARRKGASPASCRSSKHDKAGRPVVAPDKRQIQLQKQNHQSYNFEEAEKSDAQKAQAGIRTRRGSNGSVRRRGSHGSAASRGKSSESHTTVSERAADVTQSVVHSVLHAIQRTGSNVSSSNASQRSIGSRGSLASRNSGGMRRNESNNSLSSASAA